MDLTGEPQVIVNPDLNELRTMLFRDPSRVAFVGTIERIGFRAFCTFLEYRHFPPQTERNRLYWFIKDVWHELIVITIVIPASGLCHAEALAKQLGLELKRMSRMWIMYSDGREQRRECYPIYGPGVFTVENSKGHFVYQNNFLTGHAAREAETEAVDREIAEYEKLHPPVPGRKSFPC